MWNLRSVLMAKQVRSKAAPPIAAADEHELVAVARGLGELIVNTKDTTITLRRGAVGGAMPMPMPVAAPPMPMIHHAPLAPVPAASAAPAPGPVAVEDKAHAVTSPFVGTFYRKP